jgi:hypothetical protein
MLAKSEAKMWNAKIYYEIQKNAQEEVKITLVLNTLIVVLNLLEFQILHILSQLNAKHG